MGLKPLQLCGRGPCRRIVSGAKGYCAQHAQELAARTVERTAKRDQLLGNSNARGYNARWRVAAKAFLLVNPICNRCAFRKLVVPATLVDHARPHGGDPVLFWDQSNWQALCKTCHSAKTARHDGGFGNSAGGRGDQISTASAKRPRAPFSFAQSGNSGGES